MHRYIEHLRNCADHTELKSQLQSICGRFGSVARLDILIATQAGKRQALCFLRMACDDEEIRLMQELGVGRFGGDIVVVIDLHSATPEPSLRSITTDRMFGQSKGYAQPSTQQLNS